MNSSSDPVIDTWLKVTLREVRRFDAGKAARLGRRFAVSPREVWIACTDSEQLGRWFGAVSGQFYEGGTLTIDVGAPCNVTSRILRCHPARGLLFTWCYPGRVVDEIELCLSLGREGTLVELEHRSADQTDWWFGAGSGWEHAIIRLGVLLQGGDPSAVPAEALDQRLGVLWKEAGRACE